MHRPFRTLPPLAHRIAAGRPVLDQEQLSDFTQRLLAMTSAEVVNIKVTHTARVVTRLAHGQVLSGDDGDSLQISLDARLHKFNPGVNIRINQLDDSVLRGIVQQIEALNRELLYSEKAIPDGKQMPDQLVPVRLWHDETVQAMETHRSTVMPALIAPVTLEHLIASGFVGLMARSEAILTKEGISVFSEETDSEVTLTARSADGRSSGWAGQARRNWATIDTSKIVAHAIEIAKLSANPVALEPGRRTAILSAAAVAQLTRFLDEQFNAEESAKGWTAFSSTPNRPRAKLGQRVLDARLSLRSDPADSDGGYCPYFGRGLATLPMTWIENGVLKNLQYDIRYGLSRGKPYTAPVESFRMTGGATSIAEMVAKCKEGIYVNRLSDMESVHPRSGLVTGVTRDGCFLVRNGKIEKAVKNFRILDSPFFALNAIEAIGVPERVAFGYAPKRWDSNWPLPPVIVPPVMVRDFNFARMSDAI